MAAQFAAKTYPVVALALLAGAILCCPLSARADNPGEIAEKDVLDAVSRRIVKETKYASAPRYALLVLGAKAETKVWIVEDGETLYVDKNANGDLTDDGPPLVPTDVRKLGKGSDGKSHWDFNYVLDEFGPSDRPRHTAFDMRRWNYGKDEDSHGLSLNLDGKVPMYAGWWPFWSSSADTAPMIHFGGALTPRMLRSKQFVIGAPANRLSIAFMNPGRGKGADSRLSIEALPASAIPEVRIDWPVAEGAPPLSTSWVLAERCCYWEFYNSTFIVPPGAVEGTATLTISLLQGEFPLELSTDQIKVKVQAKDSDAAVD